jgi:hypothetical protein
MKIGGGVVDDEVLAMAEELHPARGGQSLLAGGLGTRWVSPIRLDRYRAFIVRGTATKRSATNGRIRVRSVISPRLKLE